MPVALDDIPREAICPICGEPMKVLHHEHRALALGFKIPEGGIFTIECHESQLRIEDEEVERRVVRLLEAYHASQAEEKTRGAVSPNAEGIGHTHRA